MVRQQAYRTWLLLMMALSLFYKGRFENATGVLESKASYDKKRSQEIHNQALRALGRVLVCVI